MATFDAAKKKFLDCYEKFNKATNNVSLSDEKYASIVNSVNAAKAKTSKKEPKDYWLLKRYDVIKVMGVEKIVRPVLLGDNEIKYFVQKSELFDILHNAHIELGHKARDAMEHEIKKKYVNITQSDIKLYSTTCQRCQEKKSAKKKGAVVRPIVHEELNSRGQVDLIDYQSSPSYENKWVMVYQDHLTNFAY